MAVSKEQMQELTSMVSNSQGGHLADPDADAGDTGAVVVDDNLDENGEVIVDGEAEDQVVVDGETDEEEIDEEAAAGVAGDEELYTPSQLAEAIGWETSDLYDSVTIPMGEGLEPVPLGELKNKYQDQARQLKALEDTVGKQTEELTQAQQGFNTNQMVSNEMQEAMGIMQSIDRMEAQIDWKDLEEMNPAEAVLKRQKFQQARQETGQRMHQLKQLEFNQTQTRLAEAGTKMIENIPTWSDPKVKQADQDQIRVIMREVGYTDPQIDGIVDPLAMTLLKELSDLRAEKAAATKAVKKVRKAPKVLRGGGGRFAKKTGEKTEKLVTTAKKTGNKHDALNAAKAILSQG